jgi:hypothetical protein
VADRQRHLEHDALHAGRPPMLDHERVEKPPRQPILAVGTVDDCCFSHEILLYGQFV